MASTTITTSNTYDVIIVGAGLSGLQAASILHSAGLKIAVLEATHRVGGKVRTVQSTVNGFNDLGATWINDSNQAEMFKLFQRFGLEGEVQRVGGDDIVLGVFGTAERVEFGFVPGDPGVIAELLDTVREESARINLDCPAASPGAERLSRQTFAEFCLGIAESETAVGFADQVSAGLLGVEGNEVSTLYMLHYIKTGCGIDILMSDHKHGGQYLRARQGMQRIPNSLAAALPPDSIFLDTPVTAIQQSSSTENCQVHTSHDQIFTARRVVMSIPTTLHKNISFIPALPAPRQMLQDSTVLGYYTKMIYVFSHPWWRDAGLSGVIGSQAGPISFSRDTSVPADGQWSISCFIVGARGRKWARLPEAKRHEQAWMQFEACFGAVLGEGQVPKPDRTFEMDWAKEPFFGGAPCPVLPAGHAMLNAGSELGRPFGRIHFVGTETATAWRGYMEGAVLSGKRGAEEVLEALEVGK
ncbi:flavin-containing amine oxidase [Aspergillus recurvatus]